MPNTPEVVTLRRYFAGQAMIALMSNEAWVRSLNSHAADEDTKFKVALAQQCWTMADVMLATEQGGAA
jgi:hypothetical protein